MRPPHAHSTARPGGTGAAPATAAARAPVLRGRDRPLAVLDESLAAVARGQGGVLVVEGPPGIGKSAFLAQARSLAAAAGVLVLSGEADERRRAVPFAPLLAALGDLDPRLGEAGPAGSGEAGTDVRYWMLHDLQDVLETAALPTPVAVVLDDVQWADPGTLAALATLPRRLAGAAILWVVAMRAGDPRPAVREAVARLTRDGARRLSLGPLAPDAVAAVLGDRLGAEADPALLDLAERAKGNPFLLAELAEGLREEDRVRTRGGRTVLVGEGLPRRLTDSMRERLDRLSGDARRTVQVASVLASRFPAEQLAAMLERRPSTLVAPLEEALRADLLAEGGDLLAFRHDLLRRAVLETLPAPERRALQRRAVTVLLERGAAPVEVALQLADSADPGDREAVARLREAAQALSGSDAEAAADLSARALELMPAQDPDRGRLVAETVLLLHWATRPADARALGHDALAGGLPPEHAAEIRLSLASMHMRPPGARAQDNERALELPGLEPHMRARHLAWLAYNLASTGEEVDRVTGAADAALALAGETGDTHARVVAMLGQVCADGWRGRCRAALERSDEVEVLLRDAEPEPYLRAVPFHRANVLSDLGRIGEALAVMEATIARGRRERNAWLVRTWSQYGSLLRLSAGRLADARAEAEGCETVVGDVVAGYSAGVRSMLTLAQVAIHTGDRRQLQRSAEEAGRVHRDGGPLVARGAAWILALAAIARGDAAAAARVLRGGAHPAVGPFVPGLGGHHPTLVRIGLAAGDPDLVDAAVRAAEALDRASPGVALLAGAAGHARGLAEGDPEQLSEAARVLRGAELPLMAASASEDAAAALGREGHVADAVAQLTGALDVYLDCEASADARRVSRELRHHGVRRRSGGGDRPASGWAGLTASELRVARLIADGARNREAAEQLCLSPHTVSSHLRSAFAKLGITSRTELARIAMEHDRRAAGAPPAH